MEPNEYPDPTHAERMAAIRAKIAEADADPRPSLTEAEVRAHFAARFRELSRQN